MASAAGRDSQGTPASVIAEVAVGQQESRFGEGGGRSHSTAEVLGQCELILEDPSLVQDSFESGDPQYVFLPGGASHVHSQNGRNSRATVA